MFDFMRVLYAFICRIVVFIQQNIWPIFLGFCTVIGWFLKPKITNYFNNMKRIVIEGNNILNINTGTGLPEQVAIEPQYFSNLILNELTVHNKREVAQSVTEIELFNISKSRKKFPDIQFDGGFDDLSQNFMLIAYNNGNDNGVLSQKKLQFILYENHPSNGSVAEEHKINSTNLASGEVKIQATKSLHNLAKKFAMNTKLNTLVIKLVNEEDKIEKGMLLPLIFDRKENRFFNAPRGAVGPTVERVPLFNLTEDVSKKTVSCSQSLSAGSNKVSFLVLVDRSCQIEYNIALFIGEKRFEGHTKYQVDIRVPIYKQEHGCFMGEFYWLLKDREQNLRSGFIFSLDDIRLLNNDLIYNIYQVAENFYDVKIDR